MVGRKGQWVNNEARHFLLEPLKQIDSIEHSLIGEWEMIHDFLAGIQ
jgi:hypothetical protein